MVTLKPVTGSSQIVAYGYDPVQRVLAIQFKAGTHVYHYRDVPQETADAFEAAESKGKFFGAQIRDHYPHTKVQATQEAAAGA